MPAIRVDAEVYAAIERIRAELQQAAPGFARVTRSAAVAEAIRRSEARPAEAPAAR